MRNLKLPTYIQTIVNLSLTEEQLCMAIDNLYDLQKNGIPDVSIVIPAYNEEKNILKTIYALLNNQTRFHFEIIVVNNNSTDRTEEIIKKTSATYVFERVQGITAARNAGLKAAKGTYILNADADTIYPKNWIEEMVGPMVAKSNIALVYGNFSFIPTKSTPRWVYFFYEYFADIFRWINKNFKEEAVNVYGFNSGFKKSEGIAVNGFEHPIGTNEDGWLAIKLRDNKFGSLYHISNNNAIVWTSDRRIQMDGGLIKGIFKRIKRILGFSTEARTDL